MLKEPAKQKFTVRRQTTCVLWNSVQFKAQFGCKNLPKYYVPQQFLHVYNWQNRATYLGWVHVQYLHVERESWTKHKRDPMIYKEGKKRMGKSHPGIYELIQTWSLLIMSLNNPGNKTLNDFLIESFLKQSNWWIFFAKNKEKAWLSCGQRPRLEHADETELHSKEIVLS
jgi:hypothetical protein